MENYPIGIILKEYRTRLNISQEELCLDLCAVSTLSRIESGTQVPGRKLIEALFSRMGMSKTAPITKVDFQRENLEDKINNMVSVGKFDVFDLLEEYKNCGDKLTPLEEQFYLLFKTVAEDHFKHDCERTLKIYTEALKISIKDYELGKLPETRLLTRIELLLLNNIARTQYFYGQKDEAIELMEFLRSYFEKEFMNENEKAINYPVILFNLENWYGWRDRNDDFEKVLKLCDIGINVCIQYGRLFLFPYHIFNKGDALVKLGRLEEGKSCLIDALTILERMKKYGEVEHGKKWVKENLDIDL
jgi:transcriptional regulator with XRE-family HTH domain